MIAAGRDPNNPGARYRRVQETAEEVRDHERRHKGAKPRTYRYECLDCGRRLWGSGLGIGSHNRYHERHPS